MRAKAKAARTVYISTGGVCQCRNDFLAGTHDIAKLRFPKGGIHSPLLLPFLLSHFRERSR